MEPCAESNDLEEALLTDGTEEPSWLQELIVLLLKGCLHEHDISLFNYQMFLRRLFRKKCEEYDILNPFNTDIDFELLPLRVKVEILYNLCEFRLDAPDVLDELKNLEADSLRVEPIGYDGKKSAYWYFYGTRLYREDFPKSEKPIWQVVCFTITDWSQLARKLEDTKCKAEQSLYKTLKKNFIPELPRLFLEKETIARKRLLEAKRSTKEESFLIREDYYTDLIRKDIKRHEISRRFERKSPELFDDNSESRYEMGKSKDKKHKQKDGAEERTQPSPTKSKDAKPVGRQTNNSLASATGQILIEPVSNPTKKKMKTSQVFSQSEEDLQVGLHKILDAVKDHEDAWPFVNPVEEEYAPNYYSIIRKPMDLQKMEERLENGHYKTFSKFRTDFQLIVNNCKLYNGVENEYSEMVDTVLEFFNRSVERYLDQITSSDDEIAVEFPNSDKNKKKKHPEVIPKKKPVSPEQKKAKTKSRDIEEDVKIHKKKKDKDKEEKKEKERDREDKKDKEKDRKDKIKADKKDKEKEKENKRVKEEYREIMSPKKAKKRKSDVLEDHKSKRDEREAKIRKQEVVKDTKNRNKVDDKYKKVDKEKDKIKSKKSKEIESKTSKKGYSPHSPKKHKSRKNDSRESNLKNKPTKKSFKKGKHSVGRSQSRSRSRSFSGSRSGSGSRSRSRSFSRSRSSLFDRWSSSPPPSSIPSSPEMVRKVSPSKHKKSSPHDEVKDKLKSKQDKWKDLFKDDKANIGKNDPIKPKDKHHTLSETIEKLKAKSDLTKLKVVEKEKSMKIYDFPSEPKEVRPDSKKDAAVKVGKKKETVVNKKKKLAKDLFEDDNSTADSVQSEKKVKNKKAANCTNNSKKYDALSLATEQTLKDINKWLDDTPKEFSSATNSPSAFSSIDEFDNNTNKSSDLEKKKSDVPSSIRKETGANEAPVHSNNGNSNSSLSNTNANAKKRPMNRDPTKMFRRKEVQRTIERLQPGKSKGNLITNVQNKDSKQEEVFPLGPLSKIKDTKNSLIVKTDDSAPKLSLGSVLDSFGKHKFIDDDVNKDNEGESDKKSEDKVPLDENKDDVKCEEVKADSPKLDNSPGTATPNLSAWFKAFGGPKVQSATKKSDAKEEKTVSIDTTMENKKEETRKVVVLPDPSPNPDSPLMNEQPAPRQRKVSTGSSMSERSSFSQDMDSPRVGIDERISAYPAPYPSPLHKSPVASPSLRSPLPDASPKSTAYSFNGQIRVGFYQDTVSTKSSPDKSCSPRDNPQSPYPQYSEHVYTPPTTQNANYSYNNPYYQPSSNYSSSNPTPPYNAESSAPSYYDTTKPLTDQYQAKNPNSPVAPQSQQPSPLMSQQVSPNVQSQPSPIDMQQHYQQPHSPAVNQQVQDAYARQTQTRSPMEPQQPSPQQMQQLSPQQPLQQPQQQTHSVVQQSHQQQVAPAQQDKFMYGSQQLQPTQTPPQQIPQLDATAAYRSALEYGRQQPPPNVEPFRTNEPKLQQTSNSYPVKKRAYNEIEQTTQRTYEETHNAQNYPSRDPPKYIHQNIPEPRLSSQVHATQQIPQQIPQQQNALNQFTPSSYNYPPESGHQYPPLNIPSAGRSTLNPMGSLDESRKIDMSKYTNMGYTGPDINLHLQRTHHYKQPTAAAPSQADSLQQQQQRYRDTNVLNMNNYKAPAGAGLAAQGAQTQGNEPANSFKADVGISRPTYHGTSGQLEMDQSLSLRGLTHIVDRYPNEESRMLGLQGNPPPSYYSDKNLSSQHMFAGKAIATSASTLPMFSQSSTMSPYGMQTHPNMYQRQMTDLQVPMSQSQPALQQPQQQQAPVQQTPAAPEPKPKKKRMTKAAKAAAAAAAAAQAAQQQQTSNPPATNEPTPAAGQGFQSYAGLKTSTSSMEPSAISLKTASVVPGSAFNFGSSTTGLSLPPGLYGDKDAYPNFLEDFRSTPSNYYMAAAAAAHHRSTPENPEKTTSGRVPAHQSSNPSSVSGSSPAAYPFIGAPQARPPSYPLPGVPGPFMPPHQAPLMDTSSPQYLQYLQAGVLHQGLLPPGAYAAPGYHPALSIRQQYDSMTRPPWL